MSREFRQCTRPTVPEEAVVEFHGGVSGLTNLRMRRRLMEISLLPLVGGIVAWRHDTVNCKETQPANMRPGLNG